MGFWAAAAPAIAGIAGGILGYKGSQQTNTANKDIATARNLMEVEEAAKTRDHQSLEAQINRNFQADQVSRQMGFQERMSSTAVQRRMADMKEAGINPILAGKYDASSPAGAAGSGGIPGTAKANAHGYTAQNKIQAALDNINAFSNARMVKAEADKAENEASITGDKSEKSDFFGDMWRWINKQTEGTAAAAEKFQSNAKQGKYVDAINRNLDKADAYLEKGTKENYDKMKKTYEYWKKNDKDINKAYDYYKSL